MTITIGQAAMGQAITDGWIKSFRDDSQYRGYVVIASQKLQRAFKAYYGYSFGREAYIGTSFDFYRMLDEIK